MEDVKAIILSFSKPEMKYLKTLLDAFHGKSNENKMLELVTLIEKKPDIQQAEAAKKLYGDPKTKAFLVMKARLMERLHEVLLASPKIANNPSVEEDENAYAYLQLLKDFAIAIALRRRGLANQSKEILQECLKNPHTHLNLSFKVMLLEYFRTTVESFEDLEQVNKDLEYAIPQQKLAMEVLGFLNEARVLEKLETHSNNKYIEYLSNKLEYLDNYLDNEKYYSPKAHFGYLWIKINLYNAQKDTQKAQIVIDEMEKLFRIHNALETNNLRGLRYVRLAETNLLLREYSNACKNAKQASIFFRKRPVNYWFAKCVEAFSLFYMGERSFISEINNDFKATNGHKNQDIENILHHLCLSIEYVKGNIKSILLQIHELEVAYSNKGNTNVVIRIFEIMLLIELEDTYFAELKIDALRKHIERHNIRPRDLVCYKILNQLQLQSFNFQKDNVKISSYLIELSETHKWKAYSFEVIRFETWFLAMKNKVSYWELFTKEEAIFVKSVD